MTVGDNSNVQISGKQNSIKTVGN